MQGFKQGRRGMDDLTAREARMLCLRNDFGTIIGTDLPPCPLTCHQEAALDTLMLPEFRRGATYDIVQ